MPWLVTEKLAQLRRIEVHGPGVIGKRLHHAARFLFLCRRGLLGRHAFMQAFHSYGDGVPLATVVIGPLQGRVAGIVLRVKARNGLAVHKRNGLQEGADKRRAGLVLRLRHKQALALCLPFAFGCHCFKAGQHFFLRGVGEGQCKRLDGGPSLVGVSVQQVSLAQPALNLAPFRTGIAHYPQGGGEGLCQIPALTAGLQSGKGRNGPVQFVQHCGRRGFQNVIIRHNQAAQGVFHQLLAALVKASVLFREAGNFRLFNHAVTYQGGDKAPGLGAVKQLAQRVEIGQAFGKRSQGFRTYHASPRYSFSLGLQLLRGCLVVLPGLDRHFFRGQRSVHNAHQHGPLHSLNGGGVNAELRGLVLKLLAVCCGLVRVVGIDKLQGHGPAVAAQHYAVFRDNGRAVPRRGVGAQYICGQIVQGVAAHFLLFARVGMVGAFLRVRRIVGPPGKAVLRVVGGYHVRKLAHFIMRCVIDATAQNCCFCARNPAVFCFAWGILACYTMLVSRRFRYAVFFSFPSRLRPRGA